MIQLKGDKTPIGGEQREKERIFTSQTLNLKGKNTMIYLYSDGYQDQFGGAEGKKFLPQRLKKALQQVAPLATTEQLKYLQKQFDTWRNNHDQVDDVTIWGIRLDFS